MKDIPPIYFYVPKSDLSNCNIPDNPHINWSDFGKVTNDSSYGNWTVQTFLRLKADGLPCQLVGDIPNEGIVIAHRSSFPFNLRPQSKLLLVSIKADYDPHPYAQLQIVQNVQDVERVRSSYYIPFWSQPGIIPRKQEREDTFENIAYFGIEKNLAPELQSPSWSQLLETMGWKWQIMNRERWHDYSEIDAVVAVRSFEQQGGYDYKPATKLYNSWLGHVPAILGSDSAFRNERRSELDYLEVTSLEDLITALKKLRDDKNLRSAMVQNGQMRSESFKAENIVAQWRKFITDVAIPTYYRWHTTPLLHKKFCLARHYLTVEENNLKPHKVYPHDFDIANSSQIAIDDAVIISSMQLYRKVRRIISR